MEASISAMRDGWVAPLSHCCTAWRLTPKSRPIAVNESPADRCTSSHATNSERVSMYPSSHILREFATRLQRDSFRRIPGDCSGYCSECRFRWGCAGLGRNPLSLCNYNGKRTATNPAKRGVRDYESPAPPLSYRPGNELRMLPCPL